MECGAGEPSLSRREVDRNSAQIFSGVSDYAGRHELHALARQKRGQDRKVSAPEKKRAPRRVKHPMTVPETAVPVGKILLYRFRAGLLGADVKKKRMDRIRHVE